jgi:hypothetical protein
MIKLLIFSLIFGCSTSFSAEQVTGKVIREGTSTYIEASGENICKRYHLDSGNKETEKTLFKLSSGDFVNGSGIVDNISCRVLLQNVDYVGLKRLLGYWYSEEGIVSVKNFNYLSFYSARGKSSSTSAQNLFKTGTPTNYRYSLMPSDSSEWIVFLSNSDSTTFATIQFIRESILMKVFHSETGDVIKVLNLSKWASPKQ